MYNNIFDTHSHYTDFAFDIDRNELLYDINKNGIKHILIASSSLDDSKLSYEIASSYKEVYCSVGIHPEDSLNVKRGYLNELLALVENDNNNGNKIKAIGEIGLDFHYNEFDKYVQINIFEEQLAFAKELSLPVIIHSRDATHDTLEILNKYRPKGVVHCFSGSAETAKIILEMGMYISFTGVLTFKNAKKALNALSVIPIERLLLETDCPYMAPVPYRGQRCDSSMIPEIAKVVAREKNIEVQEVLNITCKNGEGLFNI